LDFLDSNLLWTFTCPIFFIAMPLFYGTFVEKYQKFSWSFHLVDGWMEICTIFQCGSLAFWWVACTCSWIMKAWSNSSQGSQQFDKAQCKNK
jgi:hypothetical protein